MEERGWEYRRRQPEGTVLYEAVRDNLATLLAEAGELGRGLQVVELLVTASPRFGRELLLERLATDPQFAALNQALGASGRAGELKEHRPIKTRLPEPPKPPEPGRTAVIVPEE